MSSVGIMRRAVTRSTISSMRGASTRVAVAAVASAVARTAASSRSTSRCFSSSSASVVAPAASTSSSSSSSSSSSTSSHFLSLLIGAGFLVGGSLLLFRSSTSAQCAAATPAEEAKKIAASPLSAKAPAGGWPLISAATLGEHATLASRVWVSYRDGVYDVTDFIAQHPGGANKIMLGAGGAIDPFWALYRQHDHETVRAILAQYRIGTLEGYDVGTVAPLTDPYANDPKRHRSMRVSSKAPFNAEPPLDILGENYITPNELFFVRNHLPVPHIDASTYKLTVGGEGLVEYVYTMDELKQQFPFHSLTATLQCAGNRRSEMNVVKEVKGLGWGQAAISNAQWGGVRLRDVLAANGLSTDVDTIIGGRAQHVHFNGLDCDSTGMTYSASIPLIKVMDGSSDVLLAWEMNGQPLPIDHGAPLRALIPGVVGARNVKWLGSVHTSPYESSGHWQKMDYKGFSPNVDWSNVDFSSSPAIQELPVTSAITEPQANTIVERDDTEVKVKGYAWSGGGRGIVRVDVSSDGGATWHTAELNKPSSGSNTEVQPLNRAWAWTPWSIDLPLDARTVDPKTGKAGYTITCKAIDSSYNNQPESYAPIWNLRGCLSNAWHKVPIAVEQDEATATPTKK